MKISNLTYTELATDTTRLEGGLNAATLFNGTVYVHNVEALGIGQGSVSTPVGSASGQDLAAIDDERFTAGFNFANIVY